MHRMKVNSSRKADAVAVKFESSVSPDGRLMLLDGVENRVRMVDLWQGRGERRARRKERDVGVDAEVVAWLEDGVRVSCAEFCPRATVEVAGGGREGEFLMAVGGDDGAVRIFENLGAGA